MRFGLLPGVLVVAGCSAEPFDGTYRVIASRAQFDVACTSIPTTPVGGICSQITVTANIGDVYDVIKGCDFFNANDSNISATSSGGWFSEITSEGCMQNCGSGDTLPSGAIMSAVDDRIDIGFADPHLIVRREHRTAEFQIGSDENVMSEPDCAEIDLIDAEHI